MAVIPNLDTSHLRPDFKQRIDVDTTHGRCIWCKSGSNKKKHQLLDCPNAYPLSDQRSLLSNDIFNAGQQDLAVAYINHLQQQYDRRNDGMTPFNSGRLRYQISHIPDAAAPSSSTSASTAAPTTTAVTTTTTIPTGQDSITSAPVGTGSTTSASTHVSSAGPNATSSASGPGTAITTTATVPSTPAAATTATTTAMSSLSLGPQPASVGSAIQITYENENVQPMPPQNPPREREMQRGGQIIKPLSDTKSKLSALRGVDMDFHRRESFLDAEERVYTNHFQLTLRPDQELYEYKIESNLPGRNKRKSRALMKTVVRSYSFLANNAASFATDHIDTIIAWKPLHLLIDSDPGHVKIRGDGQSPDSMWRLQPELLDGLTSVTVTFNFERIVDVTGLLRHTDIDPNYATIDLEPTKRALNILISKCFSEATPNMIQLGANKFFNKRGTSALRGSVSLSTMRGYYYTVKAGVRNVLLNINPCTSAFFNNVRVSQVMNDKPTFNPWELEGVLKGLRVHIELERGDKNDTAAYKRLNTSQARVKTIQGLGNPLQQQTFQDVNGVQQNVLAHLQTAYPNRTIHYPNLPAVNLGSSLDPKWYSPEDLRIVPYQMYKSVVPSSLTDSMLATACLTPYDAAARVDIEALNALGIPPSQNVALPLPNCSALILNPLMLLVPSQQFPFPTIQYQETIEVNNSWNLAGKKFFRTKKPAFNTLLLIDQKVAAKNRAEGIRSFQDFAQNKYSVATIKFIGTYQLSDPKDVSNIRRIVQPIRPNLVLLILGRRDVEAYSRFKDLTDRELGCHSICMTERIFQGKIDPKMGNIMMKANLKGAGSNHTINKGKLTEIMTDTLILGVDVTHPNSGSIMGCPSIAAIVGSVDNHAGRFLGSMSLQSASKKEMIDDVEGMVVERIKDWIKNNNSRVPKNIIYYRDGVSEGQYKAVRDEELSQIRSAFPRALKELGKAFDGEPPKLTAIVCAKRHHVRFYPDEKKGDPRTKNCLPGTHVDDVVTSPYYADFYLQSHAPLQGTARPAHYFILRNDMTRTVSELRQLNHELCFTYVRTTGSVSYASPAYYADRLCERGRCYLRDFLVHTQAGKPRRDKLKAFKRDEERRRATLRRTTFGPLRNADNTRRSKDPKELAREMEDRRLVEIDCCNRVMRDAEAVFYRNGPARNPWRDSVAHTMFWM